MPEESSPGTPSAHAPRTARTVLITGGGGGIGSALARILVARGDRAVVMGRRAEVLESLAAECGPSLRAFPGDAAKAADLAGAVQLAVDHFGSLDGLAHCVGSIVLKPLHMASEDDFLETLRVNTLSAFLACKAALAVMRPQRSGSIVLVSTVAAQQGLMNHELIAAAKGALESLVRSAAITYARTGIRFNAVAPALTDTPLSRFLLVNETSRSISEAMHPLGRVGNAAEVAGVLAFLLGPESSWITGQIWGVDGGLGAGVMPPYVPPKPKA